MSKICPECGKSFNGSQGQKYCSYRCCKRHNRKAKEIKHPDPPKGVSIIRAFSCKECWHEVLLSGKEPTRGPSSAAASARRNTGSTIPPRATSIEKEKSACPAA